MAGKVEERAAAGEITEERKTGDEKWEEPKEDMKRETGSENRRRTDSAFEGIYDRMPDISVRALDRFILICVIALVAVIAVGILRANHIF